MLLSVAPQIMKWKVKYPWNALSDTMEQSGPGRLWLSIILMGQPVH